MNFKSIATALTAAAGFAAATSAGAAVMVIGPGPGAACYEAAEYNRISKASIAVCDEALEQEALSPRDRAATYTNRAYLQIARNEPMPALRDVNAALKIQPSMTAAAVNKSAALIMLNRFAEAKATIDEALPLASGLELQRALYNRALANESLGDVKAAYADLKRALELDPKFEEARIELTRYQVRSR